MKVTIDIDPADLPRARGAVLKCWCSEMGVDFNPNYLDEELTQDVELGESGLVDAHNTLLELQYAIDNNGEVPDMKDRVLDYIGQLLVRIGNALCCKAEGNDKGAYENLFAAREDLTAAYENAEEEI